MELLVLRCKLFFREFRNAVEHQLLIVKLLGNHRPPRIVSDALRTISLELPHGRSGFENGWIWPVVHMFFICLNYQNL